MRHKRRILLLFLLALAPTAHAQAPPGTADSAAHAHGAVGELPAGMSVRQVPTHADTSRVMPRIYLAWGAPFGQPGARDHIAQACGDTAATDTLYVSMDPMAVRPRFIGWLATLYFRAAPGDTLPAFWQYATGGPGRSPVRNEVADARTPMPGEPAWPELQAFGGGHMDHTGSSARLRMVAAVDLNKAPLLVPGRRYTLARVIVRRPATTEAGCGRAMCVELATIQCTFGEHTAQEPVSHVGQRFARMNDPQGEACGDAVPAASRTDRPKPPPKRSRR